MTVFGTMGPWCLVLGKKFKTTTTTTDITSPPHLKNHTSQTENAREHTRTWVRNTHTHTHTHTQIYCKEEQKVKKNQREKERVCACIEKANMDEMDDLDALIDDENEMETYIDEDEEDMAFLAEQDDGDEGEEKNIAGGTQNPPGTQDLDWLENEAGATQNSNKKRPSSREDFENARAENDGGNDASAGAAAATAAAAKKRLTNPTPSLTEEELAKELEEKKRKQQELERKERELELELLRYKSVARNAPPLLTSAEAVSAGFKVVSVTDPNDVTKRVYLKVEERPLGELDGDSNDEHDVLLSENQLARKKGKRGYDHARATINRIHLLNEPINDMLMEIEEKKSAALAARLAEQADRENTMPTEEEMRSAEEEEKMSAEELAEMQRRKKKIKELKAKIASSSWLTKYAPRKFTDLISDERSNRELLRWLKMWDKIVFNKKTPDEKMNHSMINPSVMNGSKGQNRNNNGKYQQKTEELYDASGRPMKKIALVSGGPGVGKTTLAHIAAKHAGYRVVEINASSTQKSSNGLVEAVKQAVEMRSVLESMKGISVSTSSSSQNAMPNCLVIDEIDAIFGGNEGKGAMGALLKLVNGTSAGKKKNSNGPLNRPIILICNDMYSAALRQLREVSKLVRLRPPMAARVTNRLREISVKEKVSSDPRALSQLAEMCELDIRACLNHLQYKSLGRGKFTMADAPISGENKDIGAKALEMMRDVYRGRHTFMEKTYPGAAKHFDWMYDRFETFGDDNLLLESTFENLPSAKLQDSTMEMFALASKDISNADVFKSSKLANSTDYFYSQIASVHHRASGCSTMDSMEFPKIKAAERELQRKSEISKEWMEKAKIDSRSISMRKSSPVDVLPYVLTIIAPDVGRAAGYDFMSQNEAEVLKRAVDVTRSVGLTYAKPSSKGSFDRKAYSSDLQLQPAIDELVKYGCSVPGTESKPISANGAAIRMSREEWIAQRNALNDEKEKLRNEKLVDRRELGPNARALVAREVAMDEIRERARSFDPERVFTPEKGGEGGVEKKQFTNQNVVNLPQSAAYDEMKKAGNARLELGFSGGNKHKMAASTKPKSLTSIGVTKYKYNEGFTNALRRTVYMKDLFPEMVASKDVEDEEQEEEPVNVNNVGEEAMMV
jgi:chromosome transmission fidelity protein 18